MGEKHEINVLLLYSSEYWAAHFRNASFELKDAVVFEARELCRVEGNKFQLWFFLFCQNSFQHESQPDMNDIRLAAFNEHQIIAKMIMDTESVNLEASDQIKRTALIWAAELGYESVVQVLLDKGAKVNAQGRGYGNALQAASIRGHEEIVKMLLNKGAEVNVQGGFYGNALQAASNGGHKEIVKMLLDKGAEVNAQGGRYGNALQAASNEGHEEIMKMLLNKNAEVNVPRKTDQRRNFE